MKINDANYLSSSQYASADKLQARWDLYKDTIPKINIHQVGINHLQLTGSESILEVGCGTGDVLLNLRRQGHQGELVGLEINDQMFRSSVDLQQEENLQPPIKFIVGSADQLPFPDKSFDVILAFFMLYHLPDIRATLQEWYRVLKDGGRLLIATSSQLNKPKQKQFKKLIEPFIGGANWVSFNKSFNLENAAEQLDGTFTITDQFVYEGQIKITTTEPYLNAFNSIRDLYDPIPTDDNWRLALATIKTEIEKEIADQGFFTDSVRRGFLICEKI